jgi:hypothetical protein
MYTVLFMNSGVVMARVTCNTRAELNQAKRIGESQGYDIVVITH